MGYINARLTKLFFVTRLTKGMGIVTTPSKDFPNRTPNEIDFGINRYVWTFSTYTYQNEYNRPRRYVVMTS